MVDKVLGSGNACAIMAGWTASRCAPITVSTPPFWFRAVRGIYHALSYIRLTKGYRDMGFYVIKHTDGNIMPALDQLCRPIPRVALARSIGRDGYCEANVAAATRCRLAM